MRQTQYLLRKIDGTTSNQNWEHSQSLLRHETASDEGTSGIVYKESILQSLLTEVAKCKIPLILTKARQYSLLYPFYFFVSNIK